MRVNARRLIIAGAIAITSYFNAPITEVHEIIEISGEEIRGERLNGTGEGIFYYLEDFSNMGVDEIKVGDVVKISWTKKDFNNENWENIHSLEKKSKFFRGNIYDRKN